MEGDLSKLIMKTTYLTASLARPTSGKWRTDTRSRIEHLLDLRQRAAPVRGRQEVNDPHLIHSQRIRHKRRHVVHYRRPDPEWRNSEKPLNLVRCIVFLLAPDFVSAAILVETECASVNQRALASIEDGQAHEAQTLLAEWIGRLNDSMKNKTCLSLSHNNRRPSAPGTPPNLDDICIAPSFCNPLGLEIRLTFME